MARVLVAAFEQYRRPAAAVTSQSAALFQRYIEEIANVRARLVAADLFVAVDGGAIVGSGTLYHPNPSATPYAIGSSRTTLPLTWATMRFMGVDPAHRGRGIGRMLLDARVERARAVGAEAVALHTHPSFENSRNLVLRLGWQRAPEYDHYPSADVCAEAYFLSLGP